MIDGGYIHADDLEHDIRRLDDPDVEMLTPTLWSVWGGRKPK
jgi:hypothetical protein